MSEFLCRGDKVRFRRQPGRTRFATGMFWEMNQDGSMAIVDDKTRRTIHRFPEDVQAEGVGPKGGNVWVDITMETVV